VPLVFCQQPTLNNFDTRNITDFKNNKSELIKFYKKISKKDVNLTTMSMASFPNRDFWIFYDYRKLCISVMNGDILLNSEENILKYVQHFSELNNFLIHFHIPHHGSHKNLIRPLTEWKLKRGIIFSGYENQYGHPSGVILRKFQDANIPLSVLTEYNKQIMKVHNYVS
jgi:hypothetical protein